MSKLHRLLAAGLVAAGVSAGLAGTARAADKIDDVNLRYEYVLPGLDNPCTPDYDDINFAVSGHSMSKLWLDNDGLWRSQNSFRLGWSGTAADDTRYTGSDHFQAHTRVQDGVAYITADHSGLLVSQGSDPNFRVRYKVHVTFDLAGTFSTFEVVKNEVECRA